MLFVKKKYTYIILALLVGSANIYFPNNVSAQTLLPRSTPEAEGIPSVHVQEFMDSMMSNPHTEVHSCIIARHGKVVAEMYPQPWEADYRHAMYSISKTFTGVAVGMCIEDGLISLSDTIGKFIDIPTKANKYVHAITIRDLLTMQSGLPVDTRMRIHETEWLEAYLHNTPKARPGTRWTYDSIMSYMLSAIVQRATGQTLYDFLQSRLFRHIGITDALWEQSPEGITCGGWGLYIRPEDMAVFGQFLLQKGCWNGKQLVDSAWIEHMMSPQSTNGRYGYHMWQCQYPGWGEANGANGQYIFVVPEADMVVSITQCTPKRAPILRWIKEILVDNCSDEAIPSNYLTISFDDYTLPLAQGDNSHHIHVDSTWFSLDKNALSWRRLRFSEKADTLLLHIVDTQEKVYTISLGYGKWIESEFKALPYYTPPFQGNFSNLPTSWHVAGSYAWSDSSTLNIELHWVDWLTSASIQVLFSDTQTHLSITTHDTRIEEKIALVSKP